MSVENQNPTAIDVFAGCGGLSLGMQRAGFDVVGAVELDAHAAASYRRNHSSTYLFEKDIREVSAEDLREHLGGRSLDVLVGCAPCQGFCSLTRKWQREDPRNLLVLELCRLAQDLEPQVLMMENVPGLETVGRTVFKRFLNELRDLGYYPTWKTVQMADYGVPQSRRRLVLLAGKGFCVPIPEATHSKDPTSKLKPWRTLRDAIGNESAPLALDDARRRGGPRRWNWHVVRDLAPQTKARLSAATPGSTWLHINEDLRPECHKGDYQGFTNVYGRMTWDNVSPTITAGCTTPAKGRFGHPDRRRKGTISVREAATIQTFPKSYIFATEEIEKVCSMVGNAVPPLFAKSVGIVVKQTLRDHRRSLFAT